MKILPINELRTLLAAVASHGERHLAEVNADLQQTTFLLDEAIAKLGSSFMQVHQLITEQQAILTAVAERGELTPTDQEALLKCKEAIGGEINAMVTGLQFQDMTNQLLHRTMKRVQGLNELLHELEMHGYDMDVAKEHEDIAKFLSHLNENLHAGSHALSGNLRKAVGQQDMATGDIDLF